MNFVAELLDIKRRVAELEKLFFGLEPPPRSSRVSESEPRFRAGKRLWSPEDDTLLCERYPHEATQTLAVALRRTLSSVLGRAANLGLKKTSEYLAGLAAASKLREAGAVFRFGKGHVPANKGLRRPGYAPGRMRETQFRKGQLPPNHMPIGSTRLVGGYLYRKISDTRHVPWTRNWVVEHVRLWEEVNGPLPKGHALAFKNGDRTDLRLDNIECFTRRELMARNSVHNLPKELRSTIQLLGALNRQINRRSRHDSEEQN
jgi:hypothetical protein